MDYDEIARSISLARLADIPQLHDLQIEGADPVFSTNFKVGELAALSLGLVGLQAASFHRHRGGSRQAVRVDVREAAINNFSYELFEVDGQRMERPDLRNAAAGLYRCGQGGWVYLQGIFPALRQGTLDLLGCADDRGEVARSVASWDAEDLEDALARAELSGARLRSWEEWQQTPQGRLVTNLPAVTIDEIAPASPRPWGLGEQPLSGVRVLELVRVLAGPVCGKTMAALGAEVLNVSAPNLPALDNCVIDSGNGKRNCYLDIDRPDELARLKQLVAECDVFVDGYRSGSLAQRGLGPADLAEIRPGIVYVSINCYGHGGPWERRRGWEQLAQSVSGIANEQGSPTEPELLPAGAPHDYCTGYLAAHGAIAALGRSARLGGSYHVKASLCQTSSWLQRLGRTAEPNEHPSMDDLDSYMVDTKSEFGMVRHLRSPIGLTDTPTGWRLPPAPLGSEPASWGSS